jgi:hypothetical protein
MIAPHASLQNVHFCIHISPITEDRLPFSHLLSIAISPVMQLVSLGIVARICVTLPTHRLLMQLFNNKQSALFFFFFPHNFFTPSFLRCFRLLCFVTGAFRS